MFTVALFTKPKVGDTTCPDPRLSRVINSLLFTTEKEATVLKIFGNVSERGSKVRTY